MRPLLLALVLAACIPADVELDGSSSSSTSVVATTSGDPASSGVQGTTGEPDETTGAPDSSSSTAVDETGEGSTGSTTGGSSTGGAICGDGIVGGAEACDDGQETLLCDNDCTAAACGDAKVNAAAGEGCDDGNVDATDACLPGCVPASCGDGFLQDGVEECDDGNTAPGDGCDDGCGKERWSHVGVTTDVPVADLEQWEPCWSGTYQAGGLVSDVLSACTGDHIMIACRPAGSQTLTLAAHAPRADVFLEPQVDPASSRHEANGVAWYFSPWYGLAGFGPGGNKASCFNAGQDEQLCWRVGGNMPLTFNAGYRCGSKASMYWPDGSWERVVYQAWD